MTIVSLRTAMICCLLSFFFSGYSQGTITPRPNVPISTNSNGYYEFLPSDYNSNTNTYPLILFLSGFGAVGNGSSTDLAKILEDGPFYYLNQYQVNGVDFPARPSINKAIMICPQWIDWNAQPEHVNQVLNYIFANYRVNPAKVYLTGLSSGGGVAYNYAASNLTNARKIAAMVNFAPGTAAPFDVTGPTQAKGDIIAQADIALWAFHFSNDNVIPISTTSAQWVQFTNNPTPPIPPPTPLARTTFPASTISGDQHSIWPSVYRGSDFIFQAPSTSALLDGMNMYEWLFQFSRVGNSVLPVRFGTFNARCADNKIQLTWKTLTEQNTKHFVVEKSINGSVWNAVATINAIGQSNSEQSYSYSDASTGNSLYRIVAYDHDGKKTTSAVLRNSCGSKENFAVYPNPVRDQTTISLSLSQQAKVRILVHDYKGALVYQTESVVPAGINQIPVNMNALPKGSYTLSAQWNDQRTSVKLIKE